MHRTAKVHLVLSLENQGWIIEKMANRLREYLPQCGIDVSMSNEQRPDVDLNHWMSYAFVEKKLATRASMFITHADDLYKVSQIKQLLERDVDIGICMSSESCSMLASRGVAREKLCYVLPAHDALVSPRRIRIGITTRLYQDGRKREGMLIKLARDIRLDAFRFQIFGSGWQAVVRQLEIAGAEVDYFPGTEDYQADYSNILRHVPDFDYYLYTGMDEGSLGTLDALAAGVKTIVTAQGFHLDLRPWITHLFISYVELLQVFRSIVAQRDSILAAAGELSWVRYAEWHARVWRATLQGELKHLHAPDQPAEGRQMSREQWAATGRMLLWIRLLHPRRVLSALSRMRGLRGFRRHMRNRGQQKSD